MTGPRFGSAVSMVKHITSIRRIVLLCLVSLLLAAGPGKLRAIGPSDPSATFYLSPSSTTVTAGSVLSIELRIQTTNDSTHSARARLTYPADKMELTDVTPSSSFFEAEKSYGNGVVNITYGSLSGVSGDQLFSTLIFKISASSGDASVVIDPIIDANSHSYIAGDASGTGANILSSVTNGTYHINGTSTPSAVIPAPSQPTQQQPKQTTDATAQANSKKATTTTNDNSQPHNSTPLKSITNIFSSNAEPTPGTIASKIFLLMILPALVLSALLVHFTSGIYQKRKSRSIRPITRKETVADIASRLHGSDRTKETVAEIAARMKSGDRSKETVAELAVRARRKAKQEKRRRGFSGHHGR